MDKGCVVGRYFTACTYLMMPNNLCTFVSGRWGTPTPQEVSGLCFVTIDKNRICCDQVLAITTHVENGFQQKANLGAVFYDLSSAYHLVWIRGLLLKMAKIVRCKATLMLLEKMISNRKFIVTHGGKTSQYKILQNGHIQGAVLSPMLFNIFTADMTDTVSRKFIYADDVPLVTQVRSFEEIESVLNADLSNIQK